MSELDTVAVQRVARTTASEGWKDIEGWIKERIATCTLQAMDSMDNRLDLKIEAKTWKMFFAKIKEWEETAMEANKK